MLDRQRRFRQAPGLVADGRDMGTVVFPDANAKIFLTASAVERANRRCKQLKEKGISAKFEDVLADIQVRDERDAGRDERHAHQGDQEDLESALKLFEMELEERNTREAGAVSEEAQEALSETAELLATDDIVKAEQAPEEEVEEAATLESLDFSLPEETEQEIETVESADVAEQPVAELDIKPAAEKAAPLEIVAEELDEEAIELPEISEEEVQAKVELAEAFAEMGDVEGAREILDEVMREGNDSQRNTAQEILQKYAS